MTAIVSDPDAEARRLIATALDRTLIVEAAAGTGKTTALIGRMLRVIAEGRADVRSLVAVTFTERAAGELKLRLRQGLEDERRRGADPAAGARLADAVQHLEEAYVSTIHGFCADLLRERPVEARVDPQFRVLAEGEAERLFDRAFETWLQHELADPGEGVRRSLARAARPAWSGTGDDDGPVDRLRRAGWDLSVWRDLAGAWTRPPFDRRAATARVVTLLHRCADLLTGPASSRDNLFLDTAPVRRLSEALRGVDAAWVAGAPEAALDGLEARFVTLSRDRDIRYGRKGSGATYRSGVPRAQVLEARDELVAALGEFQVRADEDLAAALHGELRGCLDEYERLKVGEGALDFLDLLLRARDLVRRDGRVRRHFQERFTHIFVDEFQDTDPLQAELLLLLAADDPGETDWRRVTPVPGKLFVVGDPKQAIYRFRRADVETYVHVCDQLTQRGAERVELGRSFRSVPNIQRAVNAAFAPVMDGNPATLQARYVPLAPWRDDHAGQPSVVALPVPAPYGRRNVAAFEIEASLPDAVGAFVDWLLRQSGWTVTERIRGSGRVPIEARHVCLLFRRFISYGEDMTRPYVEALEARGIRHLLVGGRTFHDREEIETLRAALMAIEWPDDQLSVFATLRGALFALPEEDLLEYRHAAGSFHPFRVPESLPPALEGVREALSSLASLHRDRNRRPVADTISDLLERTRAHVGFVLRPGGEQALANVLHVAELARRYELEGGMSFRGFVDRLQSEAASSQPAEAPILEEGSDGVRLMTVHKAKGLELPAVVLADMTARLAQAEPSRHVDAGRGVCALRIGGWSPRDLNDRRDEELGRDLAEGERIAYVAATRPRDLLVIPAIGDESYEGRWVSPLNTAIYPPMETRRVQVQAPGCPVFTSRDSVLARPDDGPASPATVCPGLHEIGPAGETASVVWWAPGALALGAEPRYGLRRDDLIVKDLPAAVLRRQLDVYEAWRRRRDAAVTAGRAPALEVRTATEWARLAPAEAGDDWPADVGADIPVYVQPAGSWGPRPGGPRFGTLVHALLAEAPLSGGQEVVSTLAAARGRVLGATPEEVAAAVEVVVRVLGHPLLYQAAHAAERGECYREMPVTWRVAPGRLIEGIIDLAYVSGREVVVVDFKTDRELDGALETYERQLRVYAAAVSAALHTPVRAMLLRV